jgi:hypothetical protein
MTSTKKLMLHYTFDMTQATACGCCIDLNLSHGAKKGELHEKTQNLHVIQ